MPSVLLVRGHQATPWELAPWQRLPGRYTVRLLRTRSNAYDVSSLELEPVEARTLRDRLPQGRIGDMLARVVGDRYTAADELFDAADIVHAEELGYWFAAEAARRRLGSGRFKLVLTAWETLPLLGAYRNGPARRRRRQVIEAGDLFLAATGRARDALLLEGVAAERIEVCAPGIDVDRFAVTPPAPPTEHLILSAGRLAWEKGHHDVLRAAAALHRGLVQTPALPKVVIVGAGPEGPRLQAHAEELGIAPFVEVRPFVPYEQMPALYASASALVLASLPSAGMGLHAFDLPRAFWEEQFGMVLAEAMASRLDIVACDTGAIPEVLQGHGTLVPAGDWRGLAAAIAAGPLAREPGARVTYPEAVVRGYSLAAMAERLTGAYDRLLASS